MGEPVFLGAKQSDANVICVVVHGRGQSQDDMRAMIVQHCDVPNVRFALPKSDGPGWYEARAVDPLTDITRTELAAGVDQIVALVAELRAEAPHLPLVLCGFSQGACTSMETLMRHPEIADAVCLFTGCRVGAPQDALPLASIPNLPIYASCGDQDPWIPATAFHHMLGELTKAGARLRSDVFPGRGHEVSATENAMLGTILKRVVAGQLVFDEGPI